MSVDNNFDDTNFMSDLVCHREMLIRESLLASLGLKKHIFN